MLVYERKSMWRGDTLDKLAAWMSLEPGMTFADVGCGLGYLGYTFWPYYRQGGCYVGFDCSPKLLRQAAISAREWAHDGDARFAAADASRLPLPDGAADVAMCQTLLMHMEHPEQALAEMIRIVKPGGRVVCIEPDNVSSGLGVLYSSLPAMDIADQLVFKKVTILANRGRINLGQGDGAIGCKVPRLMSKLGLVDIDVRLNDNVHRLEPPYEGARQQQALDHLKKQWLDEKRRRLWLDRERIWFLAGGGDHQEYEYYRDLAEGNISELRRQLENDEYFGCAGSFLYVVRGTKLQ